MKFWAKAVVDNDVQEQLLVDADSVEELSAALEDLLNISIAKMSILNFQEQVVDHLNAGDDIITVNVRTQKRTPATSSADAAPPRSGNTPENDLDKSREVHTPFTVLNQRPSSAGSGTGTSVGAAPSLTYSGSNRRSLTGLREASPSRFPDDDDMNISVTGTEGRGLSATATASHISDAELSTSTLPATTTLSSLFTKRDALAAPEVDRLWLGRSRLEILLHCSFGDKYVSDVIGCFVRVREGDGFVIFQITSVDLAIPAVTLDTVYSKDTRSIAALSNAAPMRVEVHAWLKRMLSASRHFPSHGFVEAKAGDIQSALRAAEAALAPASPIYPVEVASSPRAPAAEEAAVLAAPCVVPNSCFQENPAPTPPSLSPHATSIHNESEDGSRPRGGSSARGRRPTSLQQYPLLACSVPCGKFVIKTNDELHCISVRLEDSADASSNNAATQGSITTSCSNSSSMNGTCRLALYASRHSNVRSRKQRCSDFSGCHLSLDVNLFSTASNAVVCDRDVTLKGFKMCCAPQSWLGGYVTLAERRPTERPCAYTEECTGALVQDFFLLSGGSPLALFDVHSGITQLPIPMWAQNEGHDPVILHPRLLAHKGVMHVFYLVRLSLDDFSSSWASSTHGTPRTVQQRGLARRTSLESPASGQAINRGPSEEPSQSSACVPPALSPPQHHRHHSHGHTHSIPSPPLHRPSNAFLNSTNNTSACDSSLSASATTEPLGVTGATSVACPEGTFLARGQPVEPLQNVAPESMPDRLGGEVAGSSLSKLQSLPRAKYALAHAVCVPNVAHEKGIQPLTQSGLFGRWKIVNEREPLLFSMNVKPIFCVSILPADAPKSPPDALTSFSASTDTTGAVTESKTAFNLLWHAPGGGGGGDGQRPQGGGQSTTLSPKRLSPKVLSFPPSHSSIPSFSGRVAVPFQRWINTAPCVKESPWVQEVFYAAVQVDPLKLQTDCVALSLMTCDECVFLAVVSAPHPYKRIVWTLPITEEQ